MDVLSRLRSIMQSCDYEKTDRSQSIGLRLYTLAHNHIEHCEDSSLSNKDIQSDPRNSSMYRSTPMVRELPRRGLMNSIIAAIARKLGQKPFHLA